MKIAAIFISSCFLLSACAGLPAERGSKADAVAQRGGLVKSTVETTPFLLTAYYRISQPGEPVRIYFEGDGYAWVTPTRPSADPTPREPVGLELAAEDPAPNVVYLARPCQYTPAERNPACNEFFWTQGRFSKEVVDSMSEAVSYFVFRAKAPSVELIGYSGGAAVAVLVAATRADISSLRTVAGNLDPGLVNAYHRVSPLDGSLDPIQAASATALVPQIHFVGGDDEIIPFAAVESFAKAVGNGRCFQTKVLPNASHREGWTGRWKELLALPVICRQVGESE